MSEECCRKSFFQSATDTIGRLIKNPTPAPKAVQEERLTLCQGCPELDNGVCKQCGCIVRLKVSMSNMRCPLDKWVEHNE